MKKSTSTSYTYHVKKGAEGSVVHTNQLTFNYLTFFAGLILLVPNSINYKALYERHFAVEEK